MSIIKLGKIVYNYFKFSSGITFIDIWDWISECKFNITVNLPIALISLTGCIKDGFISRKSQIRILRDNVVIHTGTINSLKRFKDEVKEVKNGYECGVMIENYSDIKVGDIIETFEEIKTNRTL